MKNEYFEYLMDRYFRTEKEKMEEIYFMAIVDILYAYDMKKKK